MLYPNDADGNAIREHLVPYIVKSGYTVIDAGPYEDGTTDFSSQIAKFKAEKCEIFNTFPIPPDFATFWRQAAQQGYTKMVKIAQIAKTGLFPSQVEALGSLGDKLIGGVYWHPDFPYHSSLTGVSSRALRTGYEESTGRQWNQQLGASMSLLDAGLAALKSSGTPKEKAAVAKSLSRLKTTTIVGKVDFTSGPVPNVSPTIVFQRFSICHDCAAPLEIAAITCSISSPAFMPKARPSESPCTSPAMQIWLTILVSWPDPAGPSRLHIRA